MLILSMILKHKSLKRPVVKLPTMKGKEFHKSYIYKEYDPSKHSINYNGSIPEFRVKINGAETTEKNK